MNNELFQNLINSNDCCHDDLQKAIEFNTDCVNCINKFHNFYRLLKKANDLNYIDLTKKIICILDDISIKTIESYALSDYYKTYLLFYFVNGLWEKTIIYIYKINYLKYKSNEDICLCNCILSYIYNYCGLVDEATYTLKKNFDKKIYSFLSDKTVFLLNMKKLFYKYQIDGVNPLIEGYDELLDLKNRITNPDDKKTCLFYFSLYEILIDIYNKDRNLKEVINRFIDLITSTNNLNILVFEIDKVCISILEVMINENYQEDVIICLKKLILLNKVSDIKINYYNILIKMFNNKLPYELLEDYNNALQNVYISHKDFVSTNLKKQFNLCNLEYKMNTMFIELSYDSLTGCINRRHFKKLTDEFIKRNEHSSLIMFDIDNMKEINFNLGVSSGDVAIKLFASTIQKYSNVNSLLCRYNNVQFVLVIPTENKEEISQLINKISNSLSENEIFKRIGLNCTFSYGCAIYDSIFYNNANKLIIKAEDLLQLHQERKSNKLITA